MGKFQVGDRVKVGKIEYARGWGLSEEEKTLAVFRLGQQGVVDAVSKNRYDFDHFPVTIRFEAPDADGAFELCFSYDELEVIK